MGANRTTDFTLDLTVSTTDGTTVPIQAAVAYPEGMGLHAVHAIASIHTQSEGLLQTIAAHPAAAATSLTIDLEQTLDSGVAVPVTVAVTYPSGQAPVAVVGLGVLADRQGELIERLIHSGDHSAVTAYLEASAT